MCLVLQLKKSFFLHKSVVPLQGTFFQRLSFFLPINFFYSQFLVLAYNSSLISIIYLSCYYYSQRTYGTWWDDAPSAQQDYMPQNASAITSQDFVGKIYFRKGFNFFSMQWYAMFLIKLNWILFLTVVLLFKLLFCCKKYSNGQ